MIPDHAPDSVLNYCSDACKLGRLRCDALYGGSKNTRNWNPHGAGRPDSRRVAIDHWRGVQAGPGRAPDRIWRVTGADTVDEESAFRCEPDRPADLHCDRLTADVCRLTCLLHSGAARDKGGSSGGVTVRMIAGLIVNALFHTGLRNIHSSSSKCPCKPVCYSVTKLC